MAPPALRGRGDWHRLRGQVRDGAVEGVQAGIVDFGDLEAQSVVQREHEIEEIHGVEIELIPKAGAGLDRARLDFRCNPHQRVDDHLLDLVCRHSFSDFWCPLAIRRTAIDRLLQIPEMRNTPPRCPSLARWSAESVAVSSGRASIVAEPTRGRCEILPKPTSATWSIQASPSAGHGAGNPAIQPRYLSVQGPSHVWAAARTACSLQARSSPTPTRASPMITQPRSAPNSNLGSGAAFAPEDAEFCIREF